jgi:hypothetical protein
LLETINKRLGEQSLKDQQLSSDFNKWWPELETLLKEIPKAQARVRTQRSPNEMLEEILQLSRENAKLLQGIADNPIRGSYKSGTRLESALKDIGDDVYISPKSRAFQNWLALRKVLSQPDLDESLSDVNKKMEDALRNVKEKYDIKDPPTDPPAPVVS